ncbi:RNA methyltransferase [Ancylobacter sp. 6x-1]|uniref:RNA methyltransferase n=1 Tax=Ancylobacter crimeensis TaxID=2579147 RepID=A0ABT0D8H4_9HYPH|nr:RNA methyltransferase [Ancylobacter crimeensis]MCK0196258.1 RNA methyltransferase [Ancylobacter crimeensis]
MPYLIPISSFDDPRIEPYHAIRERDLVGRAGRFIVEGRTVMDVALSPRNRFRIGSLLMAESRAGALDPLLAQAPDDLPVYVAPQSVLDGITGFHIHRGLLGIGNRGEDPDADTLLASLPEHATILVLGGITNHDNVGGIFRNAAAFGADAVLLDTASCDPLYRKAIRVSVGGALMVPFARGGAIDHLLDRVLAHGFTPLALTPAGSTPLIDSRPPARTALLLGAEGPGLPARIMERSLTVRIPMSGDFDSLNVATAAGIALHHVTAIHAR